MLLKGRPNCSNNCFIYALLDGYTLRVIECMLVYDAAKKYPQERKYFLLTLHCQSVRRSSYHGIPILIILQKCPTHLYFSQCGPLSSVIFPHLALINCSAIPVAYLFTISVLFASFTPWDTIANYPKRKFCLFLLWDRPSVILLRPIPIKNVCW